MRLGSGEPGGSTKMDNNTLAHAMADAIFSAALEDEADDITKEQADRLYERCLAEAHHMLADETT